MAVQPLVAVVSGAVGGVVVVAVAVLVTVRLCHGRLGRRDPGRQSAADADVPSASPSPPTGKGIDSMTPASFPKFYFVLFVRRLECLLQNMKRHNSKAFLGIYTSGI